MFYAFMHLFAVCRYYVFIEWQPRGQKAPRLHGKYKFYVSIAGLICTEEQVEELGKRAEKMLKENYDPDIDYDITVSGWYRLRIRFVLRKKTRARLLNDN